MLLPHVRVVGAGEQGTRGGCGVDHVRTWAKANRWCRRPRWPARFPAMLLVESVGDQAGREREEGHQQQGHQVEPRRMVSVRSRRSVRAL